MSRIKIELPEEFLTVIEIPVRITDINYGNHVGNDALVSILQEARVQMLQKAGFKNELEIEGIGLIMAGLMMEYKQEAFYGDVLKIYLAVTDISTKSFVLLYKLTALRKDNNILIARAKTEMVCYDYLLKKIAPVPATLIKFLEAH